MSAQPEPTEGTVTALNEYLHSLRKIRSLKNSTVLVEKQALVQRDEALRAGVTDDDLRHFEKAVAKGDL
jgi:hypothetical protein